MLEIATRIRYLVSDVNVRRRVPQRDFPLTPSSSSNDHRLVGASGVGRHGDRRGAGGRARASGRACGRPSREGRPTPVTCERQVGDEETQRTNPDRRDRQDLKPPPAFARLALAVLNAACRWVMVHERHFGDSVAKVASAVCPPKNACVPGLFKGRNMSPRGIGPSRRSGTLLARCQRRRRGRLRCSRNRTRRGRTRAGGRSSCGRVQGGHGRREWT